MKNTAVGIISANYQNDKFESLVERRPVASLPFGGRYRLIDFPLSNMINSGIKTVGIITPHYYRSLLDHVGIGKPWGLARNIGGLFFLPGTIYGTRETGSRFLLKDLIRNEIFLERSNEEFVVFMDSSKVMNMDLRPMIDAHAESGFDATMLYAKCEHCKDGLFLAMDEGSEEVTDIGEHDMPTENRFLDCFVTSKEFVMNLIDWYDTRSSMDIIDIFKLNLNRYSIGSYEFKEYVGIIDDVHDYMRVNMDLLDVEIRKELFWHDNRIIYTKVNDAPPTQYDSAANVSNSLVSSGCRIEGTVENSIVFRNAVVMPGAAVKNSIILQHTTVEADAVIENLICDKYVTVREGVHISGGKDGPMIVGKGKCI